MPICMFNPLYNTTSISLSPSGHEVRMQPEEFTSRNEPYSHKGPKRPAETKGNNAATLVDEEQKRLQPTGQRKAQQKEAQLAVDHRTEGIRELKGQY